jgi:hypothetical protein
MMGSMLFEVASSSNSGLLCGRVGRELQTWATSSVGCLELRYCISACVCMSLSDDAFVAWSREIS